MITTALHSIRILVVDDEADLVQLLSYNLAKAGFKVDSAADGEDALNSLKRHSFDLVILDLMLPGIQGADLCRIIRSNPKSAGIPIIMLTAKEEVADKVHCLETGADDYMTKPFSPRELLARVRAVLRRSGEKTVQEKTVDIGNLTINKERYTVSRNGHLIHLSATEFKLLLYLVERRGRVFSRDQLLEAVWDDAIVDPRTVDVHIRRLRTQIEQDPSEPIHIKTRRGVGYYVE